MILNTIAGPDTVFPLDDKLFNKATSDIFVIFYLRTVLENVVHDRFAVFFVKELERFLDLWKFDIFVLDGVDEVPAFEQLLEGFELQLKAQVGTYDRPFGFGEFESLEESHLMVLDEIGDDKSGALNDK